MNRHQMLASLHEQGINVYPLGHKSKIPLDSWKKYQKTRYDGLIPEGQNFMVICGTISDNTIVFDFDDATFSDVTSVFPDIADHTLVVKTKRGYHVYFKTNHLPKNLKITFGEIKIDLQSDGKYVVGPTSIHPDGIEYQIVSSVTKIKLIDCREILQKLHDKGFEIGGGFDGGNNISGYQIAKGNIPNGQLHTSFLKYCNHLLFTVGIKDLHTYHIETERWNSSGNNEYVINSSDFERVRDDAWKYYQNKKRGRTSVDGFGDNADVQSPKQKPTHTDHADMIMSSMHFATLRETDEMLYYDNGVYRYGAESIIKEKCEVMIDQCRNADCIEVIHTIQRNTYKSVSEFDCDPDTVCIKNGILNLASRKVTEHNPKELFRVQLPVSFDEKAKCPKFLKFLAQCLPEASDYYTVLEEMASCLIRDNKFAKCYMHIGNGKNGKSTLMYVIEKLLGDDNISNISMHALSTERFAKAGLDGMLANIYSDIESEELSKTGVLKLIISGDTIDVEKKNKPPYKMRPYCKMFFSANKLPQISEDSDGMFRRFIITEWSQRFISNNNPTLKYEIATDAELSGILNMLIPIVSVLNSHGKLTHELSIDQIRNKWHSKSDSVQNFVNSQVSFGNYEISKQLMYSEYAKYCRINNEKPLGTRAFTNRVTQLTQLTEKKTRRGSEYVNLWIGGTIPSAIRKDQKQEAIS